MDIALKDKYDRGKELFEDGKYEEAEPLLREVLRRHPDFADVHNKLGVISHFAGRLDEAAGHLERAVELNPMYTEASLNLAITYNSMGEFEKSKKVFSRAARIARSAPASIDPFAAGKLANEHYKIGNVYLDFGMYDDAIKEYRKAVGLFGGLADVHTKLGVALRGKGLYKGAVSHFKRAKKINPNYGPARVQLGLTHYMAGDPASALKEWEDALKDMPGLKEAEAYIELVKKGKP